MSNDVVSIDPNQDEAIFRERLEGVSERMLAKRYGLTVKDVRQVIERLAPQVDHATRRNELALELERLDRVHRVFYRKSLEGDPVAASIMIRLSERKSALWGHDVAPLRQDPLLSVPEQRPGSTTLIREALEKLVAERPRPQQVEILPP